MGEHANTSPLQIYNATVVSYILGVIRLLKARLAYNKASLALAALHAKSECGAAEGDKVNDVVEMLRDITYPEFDSFCYLTEASYLIYGTTLFDTFLTETTRFLLLRFPHAMGKNKSFRLKRS
jgi:hypothetical protein